MTKEEARIQLMNLHMKDYWTKKDKARIRELDRIAWPKKGSNRK